MNDKWNAQTALIMETAVKVRPTIMIIFGAAGDLTRRKLMPAIYNLYLDGLIPEKFEVLGHDIKNMSDEVFRKVLHKGC